MPGLHGKGDDGGKTPQGGRDVSDLTITGARVIVPCPGRNFVTLKIETKGGLTGVGDATLNGRELSVASYLTDHVIPCLIGRDAHRTRTPGSTSTRAPTGGAGR